MADTTRKAVIDFGVRNSTQAGISEIKEGVRSVGESAAQAGAKAGAAFDGMGKSSEAAATKFTRSESAMGVALRRTVEQAELATHQVKSLADAFQIKADIRGFDASKFDPMLDRLRQLESQLSVAKAAEEEFAAQNAFAKKRQQATELVKAAQYTSWWAVELEKVDAAERKLASETAFVSSLKAQAAAIGKTRADLLELQAAQMGVSLQAAPFIAKLREAETGMSGAGMSTRAMSAAMRGVPAQISDIVVSLQGGMPIMTVFMQQGFQLRDMFGGFGPAGKALASTLVGLVNPYTVAAAAVVALGAAMYYAEDKLRTSMALMAQLEATGRAGYLNSDAIKQLKRDMADLPGISKSMASAIIADLVQVRTLGGEALQKIALLSADFAMATGQTAADAAKELAKAMEDPAKAAKALDDAFNFLTLEQLNSIDAMVEAGDKVGAQGVVLQALQERLHEVAKNGMTPLQEATNSFGNAWDEAMQKLDSSSALGQANVTLAGLVISAEKLVNWLAKIGNMEVSPTVRFLANLNPAYLLLKSAAEEGAKPKSSGGVTGSWADNTGGASGSWGPPLSAGVKSDADKELADLLDTTKAFKGKKDAVEDLNKTLTRLQAQQKRLRDEDRGNSKEADELQARINGVNEKIKTLGKTRDDGSKKERSTYAELAASIQAKIDVNKQEFEFSGKLNEAQKAEIKLNSDLKEGKIKLSEAHEKDLRKRIEEWKQQEQAQEKAKQNVAMYQQQLDVEKELTDEYLKRSKALESARLAMDAYEKAAQEDHDRLQLEAGLIGMSNQARALALAQYDAELELKRKIDEIDSKLDATQPEKEELRDRARVVAAKRLATAGSKAYLDEWKSSVDKYDDIFSHGFADMLNNGKDGWKSFNKSLVTTFKTSVADQIYKMFLRPFVVNVVGNLMGVEGSLAGATGGLGGGSNLLGLAQNASSLYNTGSTVAGWLGVGGGAAASGLGLSAGAGVGTTLATTTTGLGVTGGLGTGYGLVAGGGVGMTATSLGAGAIGTGLGTSAAVTGSAIGGGGAAAGAGSLMTGVMAAAPYLAAIVALYAIISGMDDSGTPHSGAGAVYSKATGLQDGAGIYNQDTFGMGHRDEYNEEMQAGISGIAKGLGQTLDAFAVSFGKTAGYSVATAYADDSSDDGSWGSLRIMDQLGNKLVDWSDNRASKWAPREFADGKEGYEEYLKAVAVDVKAAFLAMDLPGWADQALKTATDIDTLNAALQEIATVKSVLDGLGMTMGMFADLSGELQTRLLSASGGVEALGSNAGAFYESFFTEQDRMLKQRELQMQALGKVGLYIDPAEGDAAKEAFRKTVEEAMGSGQVELAAQLLAMSGAFASTADYAQQMLEEIKGAGEAWADLGNSLEMFSGITFDMQTRLLKAAGGMEALASSADAFYQGFFTEGERALRQRETQMAALAGMGLYIDPAEGDAAKELFRKTVEQAVASGQMELAAQLLEMSGAFASTAGYAQQLLDELKDTSGAWTGLAQVLAMFSGITTEMQAGLLAAAGSMEALTSGAQDFNQGFFSGDERALRQRETQMAALADMGLYIDPAEGDKAKALFRKTVEEAMASGQTALVVKLQAMSGAFAETADYAQQFLDNMTDAAAQAAAQSMSGAWSNFGTMAGLAAQYNGNTSGLSQQLGVVQGSYANATTTDGRVAALQQIIGLEQSLWQIQEKERQKAATAQQVAAQVHVDQIKAAAQIEADSARKRIDAAREQLNSANELLRAAQSLGDYAGKLGYSEASGLSEAERLVVLQSTYSGLLGKARRGDVDALDELQGVSSEMLQLKSLLSVSGVENSVFAGRVAAELASASAVQQASATSQIASLDRQIAAAEAAVTLAQETASAAVASASYAEQQFSVSQDTQKLIDALLAESADSFAKEAAQAQKLVDSGQMTVDALQSLPKELAGAIGASLIPAIQNIAASISSVAGLDVPQFAAGGLHMGGLRIVGERGPELEATGPSRIWNQAQLAGALGGGSNAELIAEIRALRAEVAALKAPMERTAAATTQHADQFDNVTAGGNAMATEAFA